MNIKELFSKAENGTLTYDQFEALREELGCKFADLKEGNYVSKSKYDADLKDKDKEMESLNAQLENLNTTITTRDADLQELQKKLEEAGQDATKVAELGSAITDLQGKYDQSVKDYQEKLQQQAYAFAVKEFANSKKFTSQAAKRDFTQAMMAKNLQMEGDKLIGGDDFVSLYSQENADAFVVEKPAEPTPTPAPTIVVPTPGPGTNEPANGGFNFNFRSVR